MALCSLKQSKRLKKRRVKLTSKASPTLHSTSHVHRTIYGHKCSATNRSTQNNEQLDLCSNYMPVLTSQILSLMYLPPCGFLSCPCPTIDQWQTICDFKCVYNNRDRGLAYITVTTAQEPNKNIVQFIFNKSSMFSYVFPFFLQLF